MTHYTKTFRIGGSASGRLFIGLLLVAIGFLFLLNNLNYIDASAYYRWWPLILIIIGLYKGIQARTAAGWVAGGTWALVGGLFLLDNMNLLEFDLTDLWPLALIWLGAFMLLKSRNPAMRSPLEDSNSIISATAVLGGLERRNNSADFKGGELTAVMGGCEIDLSKASIRNEATIDTFAFWGGIEVKVPADWSVVSKVYPILGGFEDATTPPANDSKRLIIRGFAIMGGVGVKN
jgi:hypothetical protein